MKQSTERILTTHTGSLPRPGDLADALHRLDQAGAGARPSSELRELTADAVAATVKRQADAGLDIVNDGEMGKVSYARYVAHRFDGFGDECNLADLTDLEDFPEYKARFMSGSGMKRVFPACVGPVAYRDLDAVHTDIENLQKSMLDVDVAEGFLSAVSPGVIALFFQNRHYQSEEAYLFALADAMKVEYDLIHQAGLILQIDCPDFARGRHEALARLDVTEWRARLDLHVQALNHALRDVPADRTRMHICWGNYEGPHHRDVPLANIIDAVYRSKPSGIVLESSNPRHGHEWRVFDEAPPPAGTVLIPGVIDSTTNFIEHPGLVADRIEQIARLVGRENVIAGTDCGFATGAGVGQVDPAIAWRKLQSLNEGAAIATSRLW